MVRALSLGLGIGAGIFLTALAIGEMLNAHLERMNP